MTCLFEGDDCSRRVQLHHVVPRQRIRRAWNAAKAAHYRGGPKPFLLTKALEDERNLVGLCVWHHGQVEAHKLYVTAPESAREFASEYGLLGELEADEGRRVVSEGEAA